MLSNQGRGHVHINGHDHGHGNLVLDHNRDLERDR